MWACPVQTHKWHPAKQHLHAWLTSYVGPQTSQVQGQLWEPAVLEQRAVAIAAPSLRTAHMGLTRPHDIGTEFIRQVVKESQHVGLSHTKGREGLIKAQAGTGGTMTWALRELQRHQQVERKGS